MEGSFDVKLQFMSKFLRIFAIILNNVYCFPSYIIWITVLKPLSWFYPRLYEKIEGILFSWLLHLIAFWTWNAGFSVEETGDDVSDCIDSRCLLIVNHQSTGDVPVVIQVLTDAKKRRLSQTVCWILDDMFKYTHFGFSCRLRGDFFILQGKRTRDAQLARLANHFKNVYMVKDRSWIILFPEGGFLHKRKKTSQEYGRRHGYPHVEHVTLPRSGVIRTILEVLSKDKNEVVSRMNGVNPGQHHLKYIIDVTIGYAGGRPFELLNNLVVGGNVPARTVVHYRKYPVSSVPCDKVHLTQWLYERYVEKDHLLGHFYETGSFPQDCNSNAQNGSCISSRARQVEFSYLRCLLIHAFYILSTCVHFYFVLRICSVLSPIINMWLIWE